MGAHASIRGSGRNRVYAHSSARELVSERASESEDSSFRCTVGGCLRPTDLSHPRGHHDNCPPSIPRHQGQHSLTTVERTRKVGAKYAAPRRFGNVHGWAGCGYASVIHQAVNATEATYYRLNKTGYLSADRYIDLEGLRNDARQVANTFHYGGSPVRTLSICNRHIGTS
jgi:hypothetical protein